jgi:hypothetical protein
MVLKNIDQKVIKKWPLSTHMHIFIFMTNQRCTCDIYQPTLPLCPVCKSFKSVFLQSPTKEQLMEQESHKRPLQPSDRGTTTNQSNDQNGQ